MRILFDTNVVLDVLEERAPHHTDAATLFSAVDRGWITGLLSATTINCKKLENTVNGNRNA